MYPVNDCYGTIQGEGVYTGVPAVFLRLHGCGVGCVFCDTKETWLMNTANERPAIADVLGANALYTNQPPKAIADYITRHFRAYAWVVITGGEPALYDLKKLVDELHAIGKKVAIETSGTELGHVGAGLDWVTVSPKINQAGGKKIRPAALEVADEIKHVIGKDDHLHQLEGLLSCVTLKTDTTICLQPMSQNPAATQLCVETCKRKGWRLSIQTHKLIDLP